ncbi:MAG TPA: HNH endonuclease signature motif containing protein [Prosthecobacter sp.]|nr:HNH endonuclease signature motif containing protein [Prosthecobacter sp.]
MFHRANYEPIPKPKRHRDKNALKVAPGSRCEICGGTWGLCKHHIKTKGSGGADDAKRNLIVVCIPCHARCHSGEIAKSVLRELVKKREEGI